MVCNALPMRNKKAFRVQITASTWKIFYLNSLDDWQFLTFSQNVIYQDNDQH